MSIDTLGGVFDYAVELSAWLVREGVQVTLASMGRAPSPEQRERVRASGAGLVESSYRLEWMDDPWEDVDAAGRWLLALEQRERPDVVHLNGYSHAPLPFTAPVVVGAHSCISSWWRCVLRTPLPVRYHTYRERVRSGLEAASAVVAPSAAMLDNLERDYGALPRGQVIHNGLPPLPARSREKTPVIVSVGRVWDPGKNLARLDQAAAELAWPVRIAGESAGPGGAGGTALKAAQPLGVLSKSELSACLDAAAVYCAPALYEPFGLAILEAARAGCALVLGDVPSLRELWQGAALFVDGRDSAALTRTLQSVMLSPGLCRRLGASAQRRSARFGLEAMGRAYLELYENSCRRRGRGRVRGSEVHP